jgi:hypothetical protein
MGHVAIIVLTSLMALGLLGIGVYAVFDSTNGAGTAALLTVGTLVLFVALYHDRIRSMEFGGAKIQLALKIKDVLNEAFELQLAGNYEDAENKIEFAFDQFLARAPGKIWKEHKIAETYQDTVQVTLKEIAQEAPFLGCVQKTESALSFFPLIDFIMIFDGPSVLKALADHNRHLCKELTEHLQQGELRAGVIVRPGPSLNSEELANRLRQQADNEALRFTCFLLIQNCKGSKTAKDFRYRAIEKRLHATSLEWEPESGREKLREALQEAILTVCDPRQCYNPSHENAISSS